MVRDIIRQEMASVVRAELEKVFTSYFSQNPSAAGNSDNSGVKSMRGDCRL